MRANHFAPSILAYGISRAWMGQKLLLKPLWFKTITRHDILNAHEHSPSGHRDEPGTQTVSLGSVYLQIISAYNRILSYYDKHKAKRSHWQGTFASSELRLSFSYAECKRTILSHPSWLMALAGHGWGKNFYSNNQQYSKWRICP